GVVESNPGGRPGAQELDELSRQWNWGALRHDLNSSRPEGSCLTGRKERRGRQSSRRAERRPDEIAAVWLREREAVAAGPLYPDAIAEQCRSLNRTRRTEIQELRQRGGRGEGPVERGSERMVVAWAEDDGGTRREDRIRKG